MDQGLAAEHRWAAVGEAISCINVNDKVIEEKEKELSQSIAKNYGRLKDVEKELQDVQLQLRLTSGPKKSALELIRRKIESQNDRVLAAKHRFVAARKIAEAAEEVLKGEEAAKERLCQELNLLVQQSADAQLERLQHLTRKIELLNQGFLPRQDAKSKAADRTSEQSAQHTQVTSTSPSNSAEASTVPQSDGVTPKGAGSQANGCQKDTEKRNSETAQASKAAPASASQDNQSSAISRNSGSSLQAGPNSIDQGLTQPSQSPSLSRQTSATASNEGKRTPVRPATRIGSHNKKGVGKSLAFPRESPMRPTGPFAGFD